MIWLAVLVIIGLCIWSETLGKVMRAVVFVLIATFGLFGLANLAGEKAIEHSILAPEPDVDLDAIFARYGQ